MFQLTTITTTTTIIMTTIIVSSKVKYLEYFLYVMLFKNYIFHLDMNNNNLNFNTNSPSKRRRRRRKSYGMQQFFSITWEMIGEIKCSDKSPRKLSYFWKKKTQEVIYSHLVLLYFPLYQAVGLINAPLQSRGKYKRA